mmetsp:Transcript_32777/g.75456  ORF Transcript_32777/g.75456 Transcript_32777/m.75456 type:complete len:212 (+) Transcript_32777:3-638(+)
MGGLLHVVFWSGPSWVEIAQGTTLSLERLLSKICLAFAHAAAGPMEEAAGGVMTGVARSHTRCRVAWRPQEVEHACEGCDDDDDDSRDLFSLRLVVEERYTDRADASSAAPIIAAYREADCDNDSDATRIHWDRVASSSYCGPSCPFLLHRCCTYKTADWTCFLRCSRSWRTSLGTANRSNPRQERSRTNQKTKSLARSFSPKRVFFVLAS